VAGPWLGPDSVRQRGSAAVVVAVRCPRASLNPTTGGQPLSHDLIRSGVLLGLAHLAKESLTLQSVELTIHHGTSEVEAVRDVADAELTLGRSDEVQHLLRSSSHKHHSTSVSSSKNTALVSACSPSFVTMASNKMPNLHRALLCLYGSRRFALDLAPTLALVETPRPGPTSYRRDQSLLHSKSRRPGDKAAAHGFARFGQSASADGAHLHR